MARLYFVEGLTIPLIADKCHIGSRTLYSRARRLGFKLRSRGEAKALGQRKNLETERLKLRKVLLQWSFRPDDCLYSDAEIDGMLDRAEAIAQELKTLVEPRKRQESAVVKRTPCGDGSAL